MNTKNFQEEIQSIYSVPTDSVELIETFLEKIKLEADIIRDALITNNKRNKVTKQISIEPIFEILSVLKDSQQVSFSDNHILNNTLNSSEKKLKKCKNIILLAGLEKALDIAKNSMTKEEIIYDLNFEINRIK